MPPAWERCKRCDADLACARARSLVGATRGAGGSAARAATPGTFGAARLAARPASPPVTPATEAPRAPSSTYQAFAPAAPNDVRGGFERVPTAGESWASTHAAPTRKKLPIVGAIMTIAIVGCSWLAWKQATTRDVPAEWKPYVLDGEGVEYTSAAGRFTATFPAEPIETGQSATVGGQRFELSMVMSSVGESDHGVAVAWVDVPSGLLVNRDMNENLQTLAKDWAESEEGTVTELDFLSVDGYSAVDAKVKQGAVRAKVRIIIASTRVYVIFSGGSEDGALGFDTLTRSFDLA